jgi:hypothetical protein
MSAMTFRICVLSACAAVLLTASCSEQPKSKEEAAQPVVKQTTFDTPEAASEALIVAAERFDVPALTAIVGPDGEDLVVTKDVVQDENQAAAFAAQAREKTEIVRDPETPKVATLTVGAEDWPMPIPIVEENGTWRFDSKAGREELLFRRVGRNELDAIEICRGYVEAQHEYASEKRDGARVNQYAQRVISTPGKQDGLAWQAADGSWEGPVGEGIAKVIAEGYTEKQDPFHGYYFKVLKGQGPDAPMGEMDFVVGGMMIGGFALVAAPAEYAVTGVNTFIVSSTGVVYQKDFGPASVDEFRVMERYNPDETWTPVE